MTSRAAIRSRWAKWGLFFALWTLLGLASSSQFYLARANIGQPVTWRFALGHNLADWYLFALLSIPAMWLARRLPFDRVHWANRLAIHLLASATFSVLWVIVRAVVYGWQTDAGERPATFQAAFAYALTATFFVNVLIY